MDTERPSSESPPARKSGGKGATRLAEEAAAIEADARRRLEAKATHMMKRAALKNSALYLALQDGEHLTIMSRAKLYLMIGRLQEAQSVYTQALAMENQLGGPAVPTLLKAYFNGILGEMGIQMRDISNAKKHFNEGLKNTAKLKVRSMAPEFNRSKHSPS